MASVKLPCDIEEEILSRLPPRSLVRLRTVCKHWNGLFNDKSFLNNHLSRSRPQFIILTESKIYSIDIDLGGGVDPTIEVCELPYDFPCQAMDLIDTTITACDELLFRDFWKQGLAVWNPWLRQVTWIEFEDKRFEFCGAGYDNSSTRHEKGYMILGYSRCFRRLSESLQVGYHKFAVYECASQALKFIDSPFNLCPTMGMDPLSLNGNLFWIGSDRETRQYLIQSFDFSTLTFIKAFCLLPSEKTYSGRQFVLAVYKGDRFSFLTRCDAAGKLVVWVTSKKIDREEVAWMKLMTFPTTNFPKFPSKFASIVHYIFDNTLIMCCGDGQAGPACIYIAKRDVFKRFPIVSGSIFRFSHCAYLPSLIPLPLESRSLQL